MQLPFHAAYPYEQLRCIVRQRAGQRVLRLPDQQARLTRTVDHACRSPILGAAGATAASSFLAGMGLSLAI